MGKWDSAIYQKLAGGAKTAAPAAVNNNQPDEGGGGGGGGVSLLNQVMQQGPQWGADNSGVPHRARLVNPFDRVSLNGQSNVQGSLSPGAYTKTPGGGLPSLVTEDKPLLSKFSQPMGYDPQTGKTKWAGSVTDASGFLVPQSQPFNAPTVGSPQGSNASVNGQLQQEQQPQYPSWLQGVNGGMFQPGDMPIWIPTNWVNPSNPNPQEVVPPEMNPQIGMGTGVGNDPTGLLASLMATPPTQQPVPTSAIDNYAEQQRRQNNQLPRIDQNTGLPINAPGIDLSPIANALIPQNIPRSLYQNLSVNPYADMYPPNPNEPTYASQVMNQPVGIQQGLTPGQSQNLGGRTIQGASGLTNDVINQLAYNAMAPSGGGVVANPAIQTAPSGMLSDATKQALKSDGYTDQDIAALESSRSGGSASQDKTVGGKNGSPIYDPNTGKAINPWEKVANTVGGKNVEESRGFTLDEITRSKATNLTTGFDYTNNEGYTGEKVTLDVIDPATGKNKVLPQIAGYYIAPNGKYYPIDLGIVKKLTQKGWGGGWGGGGGNWSSNDGNYKGWLASWNIGV